MYCKGWIKIFVCLTLSFFSIYYVANAYNTEIVRTSWIMFSCNQLHSVFIGMQSDNHLDKIKHIMTLSLWFNLVKHFWSEHLIMDHVWIALSITPRTQELHTWLRLSKEIQWPLRTGSSRSNAGIHCAHTATNLANHITNITKFG